MARGSVGGEVIVTYHDDVAAAARTDFRGDSGLTDARGPARLRFVGTAAAEAAARDAATVAATHGWCVGPAARHPRLPSRPVWQVALSTAFGGTPFSCTRT